MQIHYLRLRPLLNMYLIRIDILVVDTDENDSRL